MEAGRLVWPRIAAKARMNSKKDMLRARPMCFLDRRYWAISRRGATMPVRGGGWGGVRRGVGVGGGV